MSDRFWQEQVREYWRLISVDKTEIRNVMDMNAYYGGFSVALSTLPMWVMNIVPATMSNTLSAIYDRGLVGAFHDWWDVVNICLLLITFSVIVILISLNNYSIGVCLFQHTHVHMICSMLHVFFLTTKRVAKVVA